jgi:hypothetical protein
VLSTYLTYAWLYDPERPIPHLDFTLPKPDTKKPAATAKKKSSAASSMNPKQGKRGK